MEEKRNSEWSKDKVSLDCDKCDKELKLQAKEVGAGEVKWYYRCINPRCKYEKDV